MVRKYQSALIKLSDNIGVSNTVFLSLRADQLWATIMRLSLESAGSNIKYLLEVVKLIND